VCVCVLLVHCLLTVIYFINVPLIEMAAREKRENREKRGKSDCKWLHIIDAHHREEEEEDIPHRRRRRRRRVIGGSGLRLEELSYLFI